MLDIMKQDNAHDGKAAQCINGEHSFGGWF